MGAIDCSNNLFNVIMNKQFEEWLVNNDLALDIRSQLLCIETHINGSLLDNFYSLPFSMQWGVYLEFFDSVGIWIEIRIYRKDAWFFTIWKPELLPPTDDYFKNRTEAQQEAIKKAFEILETK